MKNFKEFTTKSDKALSRSSLLNGDCSMKTRPVYSFCVQYTSEKPEVISQHTDKKQAELAVLAFVENVSSWCKPKRLSQSEMAFLVPQDVAGDPCIAMVQVNRIPSLV